MYTRIRAVHRGWVIVWSVDVHTSIITFDMFSLRGHWIHVILFGFGGVWLRFGFIPWLRSTEGFAGVVVDTTVVATVTSLYLIICCCRWFYGSRVSLLLLYDHWDWNCLKCWCALYFHHHLRRFQYLWAMNISDFGWFCSRFGRVYAVITRAQKY